MIIKIHKKKKKKWVNWRWNVEEKMSEWVSKKHQQLVFYLAVVNNERMCPFQMRQRLYYFSFSFSFSCLLLFLCLWRMQRHEKLFLVDDRLNTRWPHYTTLSIIYFSFSFFTFIIIFLPRYYCDKILRTNNEWFFYCFNSVKGWFGFYKILFLFFFFCWFIVSWW